MTSFIVTEDNRTIRTLARQTLKGKWFQALAAMLLATAIGSAPGLLVSYLLPESQFAAMVVSVYTWFITGPLNLGLMMFFLRVFRQQQVKVRDSLEGFQHFRNAMGLYLIMMVKVFLLSLLLIIPGVIAVFRYSQAWFILADDPDKDPNRCLMESDYLMNGNKEKLLSLSISFIGWMLIASAPQIFIEEAANFGADSVLRILISTLAFGSTTLLSLLASLLTIFVRTYIYTAYACFYDLILGNLVVMDQQTVLEENPFHDQSGFNPFNEDKVTEIIDVESQPADDTMETGSQDGYDEFSDLKDKYDSEEGAYHDEN